MTDLDSYGRFLPLPVQAAGTRSVLILLALQANLAMTALPGD